MKVWDLGEVSVRADVRAVLVLGYRGERPRVGADSEASPFALRPRISPMIACSLRRPSHVTNNRMCKLNLQSTWQRVELNVRTFELTTHYRACLVQTAIRLPPSHWQALTTSQ